MEKLTETEIEKLIEIKFQSLILDHHDISEFIFQHFSNFEANVEQDYLSKLPTEDLDQIIFKTKKKFADSTYEGDLLNERRHGLGRMFYDSGRYYFGEWRHDLREGRGMEHYTNGNNYKGFFVRGKADGIGIFRWANGEIYEGEWKEGLKHGKGIFKGEHGDYYIGFWKNSKAEGWGKHVWPNGNSYEGSWLEYNKHGVGVEKFNESKQEYFGEYLNGNFHGVGVYKYTNGDVYKGLWENGVRQGFGRLETKDFVYIGDFSKGFRDGNGYVRHKNGDYYIGEFCQDLRQGKGEMVWASGATYKGEWEQDKQKGWGVFIDDVKKDVKIGKFEDGEC